MFIVRHFAASRTRLLRIPDVLSSVRLESLNEREPSSKISSIKRRVIYPHIGVSSISFELVISHVNA